MGQPKQLFGVPDVMHDEKGDGLKLPMPLKIRWGKKSMTGYLPGFEKNKCVKKEKRAATGGDSRLGRTSQSFPWSSWGTSNSGQRRRVKRFRWGKFSVGLITVLSGAPATWNGNY